MLATILSILVSGFVIGVLGRWAVPGPDPMPIWMTTLFGIAGSFIGGVVTAGIWGTGGDQRNVVFRVALASILATALLVIAYRRFVQKRPITGPEARKPPPPRL